MNQRVALSKRLLREALLQLLKEKELSKIRVTELCQISGINRATFYRHYTVPKDILLELQQEFVEEVQKTYKVAAVFEHPERYLYDLCDYLYNQNEQIRLFIHNIPEEDILYYCSEVFLEILKEHARVNRSLMKGQKETDLLASYFAGGVYFLLRRWILGMVDLAPKEMADFILELIRSGFWKL